jgi:hypothetical protein
MGGKCSTYGRRTRVYRVEEHERKRILVKPKRRWEDNIKMSLQGVGCGVWTGRSWLRIETAGEHFRMR